MRSQGFQSTLPRGERLAFAFFAPSVGVFQSTLPRGERLYKTTHPNTNFIVSIHAPAWGATLISRG